MLGGTFKHMLFGDLYPWVAGATEGGIDPSDMKHLEVRRARF